MSKLTIPVELFSLTKDQLAISKEIYGKIIRCLVAPYHSYAQLERVVPYTESTYLFPEREMSYMQTRSLMSIIVASKHTDVKIVTASMTIIGDMVGDLVRVLTEDGKIVDGDSKTFHANIHEIRYKILENENHMLSKEVKSIANEKINDLIKRINSNKPATQKEFDQLQARIQEIGEPIISNQLMNMLHRQITVKK